MQKTDLAIAINQVEELEARLSVIADENPTLDNLKRVLAAKDVLIMLMEKDIGIENAA